jgi:hypothetical protein
MERDIIRSPDKVRVQPPAFNRNNPTPRGAGRRHKRRFAIAGLHHIVRCPFSTARPGTIEPAIDKQAERDQTITPLVTRRCSGQSL